MFPCLHVPYPWSENVHEISLLMVLLGTGLMLQVATHLLSLHGCNKIECSIVELQATHDSEGMNDP